MGKAIDNGIDERLENSLSRSELFRLGVSVNTHGAKWRWLGISNRHKPLLRVEDERDRRAGGGHRIGLGEDLRRHKQNRNNRVAS